MTFPVDLVKPHIPFSALGFSADGQWNVSSRSGLVNRSGLEGEVSAFLKRGRDEMEGGGGGGGDDARTISENMLFLLEMPFLKIWEGRRGKRLVDTRQYKNMLPGASHTRRKARYVFGEYKGWNDDDQGKGTRQ